MQAVAQNNIVKIVGDVVAEPVQLQGQNRTFAVFSIVQRASVHAQGAIKSGAKSAFKVLCVGNVTADDPVIRKGDRLTIVGKIESQVKEVKGIKVPSLSMSMESFQKVPMSSY